MGSIEVRIPALVTGDKNLKELSAQIDIDLSHLKISVSCLKVQLDSVARVVVQN